MEREPMVHTPHLDTRYESELQAVTVQLVAMAELAERMVRDAVLCVLTRDSALAASVTREDDRLDRMEVEIDAACVKLLARRAPVGKDLRLVTGALKLVTDLERIGDLAVNVVKRANQVKIQAVPEVAELSRAVVDELSLAVSALRRWDGPAARALRAADHRTDECNRAAFEALVGAARSEKTDVEELLALTNICRHLERIGDHAVNVAEMVVYVAEGVTLRHQNG